MPLTLTAKQSRRFWRMLMANAVFLIGDAHALLENGSAARARSLLILAQEELARAVAVYTHAARMWDRGEGKVVFAPSTGPQVHLALSRDPLEKISAADSYAGELDAFWGRDHTSTNSIPLPIRLPPDVDAEKQAGFYVAFEPGADGSFAHPLLAERRPVEIELTRVAQVAEMSLMRDATRRRKNSESDEFVSMLHRRLLPLAHPEQYAAATSTTDDDP